MPIYVDHSLCLAVCCLWSGLSSIENLIRQLTVRLDHVSIRSGHFAYARAYSGSLLDGLLLTPQPGLRLTTRAAVTFS